jgi:phosphoribosylformimino-5-aminoimidazole carboxamide ribotide isomerase
MMIYPAIDLLDGECVRLTKGDFNQKKVYSDDPIAMSKSFSEAGATCLHLVDLSGAKDPAQRQLPMIGKLIQETKMKVQCGGGIRTRADVAALLKLGVDRVVIGSVAVTNPSLVCAFIEEFGSHRITLALDVAFKDDGFKVATHGWKNVSDTHVTDLITHYVEKLGEKFKIARILCTDIGKDGMMAGPNVHLYKTLMKTFPGIDFQASGGISSMKDIETLRASSVKSAVVGKAIYEGAIAVKDLFGSGGSSAH